MIKINLLPPYVLEARRMKIAAIIFAILFVLEGAGVFGYQLGVKQQTAWFGTQEQRYTSEKTTYDKYAKDAGEIETKAKSYDEYLNIFGTLAPVKAYTSKIADAFIEAGNKLGGSGAWYTTMTINGDDGSVSAKGNIKGSMRFLSYYFRLKDEGFSIKPAVMPYPVKTMAQVVPLEVSGNVSAMSTPPTVPTGQPDDWTKLYMSADEATQAGAGGAGAPGGMPGAAGGAPGGMPGGMPGAPSGAGAPSGMPTAPMGAPSGMPAAPAAR